MYNTYKFWQKKKRFYDNKYWGIEKGYTKGG